MSYGASTFAGIAITAAILAAQLRGEPVRWGRVIVLLCGVAFAGLLGAKVFFLIERGGVVWHDLGFELRFAYRPELQLAAFAMAAAAAVALLVMNRRGKLQSRVDPTYPRGWPRKSAAR